MREGRTDAWIAHQLDVSVSDIRAFKREHDLAPGEADADAGGAGGVEEPDLRAEDDALVAAALEAEEEDSDDEPEESEEPEGSADSDDSEEKPRRRRRGRRGGRRGGGRRRKELEGTFDHGEEGYGLWLDPAVADDPVYAEHWAGHRPVVVVVEAERIVITRSGEDSSDEEESD